MKYIRRSSKIWFLGAKMVDKAVKCENGFSP